MLFCFDKVPKCVCEVGQRDLVSTPAGDALLSETEIPEGGSLCGFLLPPVVSPLTFGIWLAHLVYLGKNLRQPEIPF